MNHLVYRALCVAVRTLDLPRWDEQLLLAVLDDANRAVSDGRVAEGVIILRRFPGLLENAARSNRRPARALDRQTPFERLSRSRKRVSAPAAPGPA